MKLFYHRSAEQGRLPSAYRKFLLMYLCYFIGSSLSSLSVNILLVQGDNMEQVCVYIMMTCLCQPIAYFLSGWLSKKIGVRIQITIGVLAQSVMYLLLILFGENAAEHSLLLGCLIGFAGGFFWLGQIYLTSHYLTPDTMDYGLNMTTMFLNVIGVVVPLLGGVLLSSFTGIRGYLIIFAGSLVFMIAASILSLRLPKETVSGEKGYHIAPAFRHYFGTRNWRRILALDFVRGWKEQAPGLLTTILFYFCVRSELFVSIKSTVTGVVTVIFMAYISRHIRRENRMKIFLVCSLLTFSLTAVLFFSQGAVVLVAYGLITALTENPSGNITLAYEFTVFNSWDKIEDYRAECLAIRESSTCLGRICGLVPLYLMERSGTRTIFLAALMLFLIYAAQPLLAVLLRGIERNPQDA